MELAYGLEEAANNAKALEILLLAATEAAFNGNYRTEEFEDAFYYLRHMAYEQAESLKMLEDEAFKILKEEKQKQKTRG